MDKPIAAGLALALFAVSAAGSAAAEDGLLFHLSGENGVVADVGRDGTREPNFVSEVTPIPDGRQGAALRCFDLQRLAYWAPGNVYAQRGTLAFFWRAREPLGPTEFPIFRIGYADHSSWDMVFARIDWNGHGFDAFVTDASLSRLRVSHTLPALPQPDAWVHLALAWDETSGIRFYVDGRLAAAQEGRVRLDAALDQFGPHARVVSPHQVQSDYNFVRGGDLDELRIYDRVLADEDIARLATATATGVSAPAPARSTRDQRWRDEWWLRYGFDDPRHPPPLLDAAATRVRKVEIHDAFDLKRWWWKANDGIRETTWPGVYNRSRLPGRDDYFHLPDWDCYSTSGRSITFTLPDEPWNQVEIAGAAYGSARLLDAAADRPALFERERGHEHSVHRLARALRGGRLRFDNVLPETPIGELLGVFLVEPGREPAGAATRSYVLGRPGGPQPDLDELFTYVRGRHPEDERTVLVARPAAQGTPAVTPIEPGAAMPLVHVFIPAEPAPSDWSKGEAGLDGIAIDLPALGVRPTHGGLFPLNVQVKDPLWPLRNMLDFTFSVRPGQPRTLWLDLRDRVLPAGKPLYLSLAGAGDDFGPASLAGARLRLVFKPRAAARAEHELDRFTQARDSYAMLVEEHPRTPKLKLWARFEADLQDLLRVSPEHALGRAYRAAAIPGAPRPPFVQPEPPAGVPLWAFRQVELLRRAKRFVMWYVDQRQIENGELGGGLSDDTDLTNMWPGIALMGAEPERLRASLQRVLDACYANGMFTNGLPTIQTDELHSYEEGINALGQNLILDHGSPRQLERAMETARALSFLTGVNAAGHRHIRSSYYSGTKLAEDGVWGWAKAYSYLVLQPAQLLADYNGSPQVRAQLVELADGLLAHRRRDAAGRDSLPTAIHFASDRDGEATRGYFPWPLFWTAWRFTDDRKYLAPILDGGVETLTSVNANVLDQLGLREEWRARILAGPEERPGRSASQRLRSSSGGHFAWQLSGDKRTLEELYGRQIEQSALMEYIDTEGSLWIDRVGLPYADLQRARLGGIALVRNATFPGNAVSWRFAAPASAESVAILIPDATRSALTVFAYNLDALPVRATLVGGDLDPGTWELAQGLDGDGDDVADRETATRNVEFGRSVPIEITLAPRIMTVFKLRLRTPGRPYWERPDLGLDPQDVRAEADAVTVVVHSLGSVPAPASSVALFDEAGHELARAAVPALAAPVDLRPRTASVQVALPRGTTRQGLKVVIDPDRTQTEITRANNAVTLAGGAR